MEVTPSGMAMLDRPEQPLPGLSNAPPRSRWPARLGKLTLATVLGVAVAAQVVLIGAGPFGLINLAFTIAALVYLADVRPALSSVTRG